MDDLVTTMKAQLYERVSSPLTVSFVLSWCGWNFRLIAVLLSSIDPAVKFRMIDTVLYPDVWTLWLHRLIGPLVTCLLYVFVYPYPERWAFSWAKKKQRDLKAIQASLDSDIPLTPEQSRELRLKCKRAVEETQSIVAEHEEKVASFSVELSQLKDQLSQKDEQIERLEKRAGIVFLTDSHKSVLKMLKQTALLTEAIRSGSGVSTITVDDTLNELLQLSCVRQFNTINDAGHNTLGWAITQSGLQALARSEQQNSSEEMVLTRPTLTGIVASA